MAPSAAACDLEFAARLPAIRLSVRPAAVICATIKAISTSIHNTISSAKPRDRAGTFGMFLEAVRVWRAVERVTLQLLGDQPGLYHLTPPIHGAFDRMVLVYQRARGEQHQPSRYTH